ncbi:unnamed protein product [Lactuca virosa]|uniref:Uncharacterized protein n=1 Tax=Lactuca virosa TaxID=75947 RepID=A0AAU9LIY0_9ASTR|nr:unnamed protein product [Lactuca virosa]
MTSSEPMAVDDGPSPKNRCQMSEAQGPEVGSPVEASRNGEDQSFPTINEIKKWRDSNFAKENGELIECRSKVAQIDLNAELRSLLVHEIGNRSKYLSRITEIEKARAMDMKLSLNDYRPISLIGALYKIVAKALANRVKECISSCIDEVQL